jgi:hypothetical protein
MQATLLYTDNEEAQDLVDTQDTIQQLEDGIFEFADLTFDCRAKTTTLGNGNLQIVSSIGYTYLFKI